MSNWKAIVEKKNAEVYKLPAGWDSKETVAKALECSPERVREVLRPAINARDIEVKDFPVWDRINKRVVRVTAFREVEKKVARAAK